MSALHCSAPVQGLRLTARGRQVLRLLRTLLCAVVIVGGAFFVATQSFAAGAVADTASVGVEADTVVVGEGESLWTVASNLGIDRDTRDVIVEIVEINHLSSPTVHPGQTLYVPRR